MREFNTNKFQNHIYWEVNEKIWERVDKCVEDNVGWRGWEESEKCLWRGITTQITPSNNLAREYVARIYEED